MAANASESDPRDELIELLQKSLVEAQALADTRVKNVKIKAEKEKLENAAALAKIAQEHNEQAISLRGRLKQLTDLLNPLIEAGKLSPENLIALRNFLQSAGLVFRGMPTPKVTAFLEETYITERCLESDTQRHVENYIRLFAQATGDRELGSYERSDIIKWVRVLEKLKPSYGRGKSIQDLGLQKIIEASKGHQGLNRTTIEKHITHVKAFFKSANKQHRFATSEDIDDKFDDIRLSAHVPDPRPRKVWSIKDLNDLFASPLWSGTRSRRDDVTKRHEPGPQIHLDAYWWLPIAALWIGARLEEMAQLYAEDLQYDMNRLPYIKIHDEGDRRLKNNNSIRNVPIHPFLVELGFLKLFQKKKGTRIFPELRKHGKPPKVGGLYSGHFTDYRKNIELYEELRDFHSFRRTFITTMRHKAKVDILTIAQIAGHDSQEPHFVRLKQTDDYTEYTVADLMKQIRKLDYEKLGLNVGMLRRAALACGPVGTVRVEHLPPLPPTNRRPSPMEKPLAREIGEKLKVDNVA